MIYLFNRNELRYIISADTILNDCNGTTLFIVEFSYPLHFMNALIAIDIFQTTLSLSAKTPTLFGNILMLTS